MPMSEYVKSMRKKVGSDRIMVVGAGVFIHKDGKVLLQKRRDNGCWALHGGSVEIGEKVEDAARRELFEETGLTANSLELLGVFSGENMMYTYPGGDEVCIVAIIYICGDFSGNPRYETDETQGLEWFGMNDLPKDINPPDIEPLAAFAEYVKRA